MSNSSGLKVIRTVTVLWLSDAHLGYKQYGLDRRYQDFFDSHEAVIELGIKHKINLFLDTGDILNSTRPDPKTILYLKELNTRLEKLNICYAVIEGNHDATENIHWTDVAGANNAGKVGGIKLIRGLVEIAGLKIYGVGHMSKDEFLTLDIPNVDILAIHAPVVDFLPFLSSSNLSLADIPTAKAQIICLGDLHIDDVRDVAGTPVGYTGSVSLCSESEPLTKCGRLLTFRNNKLDDNERISIEGPHSRSALKEKIETEEALEIWLDKVEKKYKTVAKKPLVYLSFPTTLDIITQCRARLDPSKWILRFKAYHPKAVGEVAKRSMADSLTPVQYLQNVMKPDKEISGILADLLDPEINASERLDAFMEEIQT